MARDVKRAEAKLTELEEKKTRLVAKLERAQADVTAAGAAQREADRLEALVELGDASAKEAQRQRASADKAEAEARRQKRIVESAIIELDEQIATAKQTLGHASRDAADAASSTSGLPAPTTSSAVRRQRDEVREVDAQTFLPR